MYHVIKLTWCQFLHLSEDFISSFYISVEQVRSCLYRRTISPSNMQAASWEATSLWHYLLLVGGRNVPV